MNSETGFIVSGTPWRPGMSPWTTAGTINKRFPTACVTISAVTLQICQPLRKKVC